MDKEGGDFFSPRSLDVSRAPSYGQTSFINSENIKRDFRSQFIVKLTIVASLGGFIFGYDTGVIASANLHFNQTWPKIKDT
jgi:hypothetical protein